MIRYLQYSSYDTDINVLSMRHNQGSGFFSCCGIRLQEIINCMNKSGRFPIVDSSAQFYKHKDYSCDATSSFFRPAVYAGIFDSCNIRITDNDSDDLYTMRMDDYARLNFKDLSILIECYFHISDAVLERKNMLIRKYGINTARTIAVCYRGNDTVKDSMIPPTYDEMISEIGKVAGTGDAILVQSDEAEFYDAVREKYPQMVKIDEIVCIPRNPNTSVPDMLPVGQRMEQAMLFLAVTSIMSECSGIVTTSGNVGLWLCLLRNSANNVHQHLHISGKDGKNMGFIR